VDNRYRQRPYSIRPTFSRDPLGRSPGDRAPPRFPPELPSLARATREGRAAAAQEGSASLWWVRVSAALDQVLAWTLEDMAEHQTVQAARTDQSYPSAHCHFSLEGPSHASPPRPLSIGQHDPGDGAGGGNASRVEVGDPGACASEIPGAHRQWSIGQSGTTATQHQRPISFAPPARSRHRRRTWRASDVRT